jgi:ornithine cyclodeaminase|tara:strand:- start:1259 stop:2212 length:954 start_codon:yes stop_codon:yes gene_type:complete
MTTLHKNEILKIVKNLELIPIIKEGFIAYSEGESVVPPVGELSFKEPPGDVHIKYGYIKGEKYYVIKIASGFYENEKLGLPTGAGLMLLFAQETGEIVALLADDAYLTDVRTAIAGAICAEQFANQIQCIGVIGTGLQARLQVQYLRPITECRDVLVWGRNREKMELYKTDMAELGFFVSLAEIPNEVAEKCNLIITTTASTNPILKTEDIQTGTHITAMGSDTSSKQELDSNILEMANLVVADSISQCIEGGEISHAIKDRKLLKSDIIELGKILNNQHPGRTSKEQITVADLTGVAVQDIQIATAVYEAYMENNL